jgi:predicted dienelactone hydrolase
LAEITLPTLVMGGTLDGAVPFDWGSRMIYDHITSTEKILVAFELGDHNMFTSTYEDAPTTVEMFGKDFYYLYSDPVWDMNRVHDLANHFIMAFLLDQLKGDAEAAAALAPDAVSFPGITYEVQGF